MLRTARWVTGSLLRDSVLFLLVWLWIRQLLIPFGEATGIPDTTIFSIFLFLLFAVDLAVGNAFARIGLKLLVLSFTAYSHFYNQYGLVDLTWVYHWTTDLYYTAVAAFGSSLDLLPESGRTTVFFLTLWMIQSFFRQSLGSRIWMFVFLILGSIGLGVLDTFFVKDAKLQIVLFLFLGLLILAFMQLPTIERIARMPRRMSGWPMQWLAWALVLSLIVVGTSSAAPKSDDPSWPDPVAYLKGKNGDGPGLQKIGYGNDDTQLGGPFQMDDSVVFTVTTNVESYYRGEVKTTYTGKGWLSGAVGQQVSNLGDMKSLQRMEDTTMETKKAVQTYSFQDEMVPVVFNQYRMTAIEPLESDMAAALYSDIDNRVTLGSLQAGDSYRVTSEVPYFDEQKLKGANTPYPTSSLRPYLALPVTLPQRVRDLAQDITKDAKTPYERAKALEYYLFSTYAYETKDVPSPAEDQDFVDQFLFDSLRGYCDHFSSSMVVMARSLGMPARWVKGFTKGDVDLSYRSDVEGEYLYTVKSRNAHSWPEIYFEDVGWVAFEPTSTFTMPRQYAPTETLAPLPIPGADSGKRDKEEEEEATAAAASSFEIDWSAIGKFFAYSGLVLLAAAILFRRRLITAYYLSRAYKMDGQIEWNALERLLLVLGKFGYKRTEDMTLREYAHHLAGNHQLRGREMIPLAKIFERTFYGQQKTTDKEKSQMRDLWTRIVRKAGRSKRN